MAKKEDFVILGRCGNVIMENNRIPHISIFITAPFEQRVKRTMEIHSEMTIKQAKQYLKKLDREKTHHYRFYTGRKWGNANNYDLCINSASYGIDGTVDFLYRMINARTKGDRTVPATDAADTAAKTPDTETAAKAEPAAGPSEA